MVPAPWERYWAKLVHLEVKLDGLATTPEEHARIILRYEFAMLELRMDHAKLTDFELRRLIHTVQRHPPPTRS